VIPVPAGSIASVGYVVVEETASPPTAAQSPAAPQVVVADTDTPVIPKRKKAGSQKRHDDEDDRSHMMLIRNIIGAVVLVILLVVAGYIYYTKFFANRDNDQASSAASNNSSAEPPPGGFVSLDDAKKKNLPIMPGNPVNGGIPRRPTGPAPGGGPWPKAGNSPPAAASSNVISTPNGVTATFPGPPQPLPTLSRGLQQLGLTGGNIWFWSDDQGNACSLLYASYPVGQSADMRQQVRQNLLKEFSNQVDGYTVVERGTIEQAGRNYDRLVTRNRSQTKTVELLALTDDEHLLIATIEYASNDTSSPVHGFLKTLR
jgi:hypothetical protein